MPAIISIFLTCMALFVGCIITVAMLSFLSQKRSPRADRFFQIASLVTLDMAAIGLVALFIVPPGPQSDVLGWAFLIDATLCGIALAVWALLYYTRDRRTAA